jgi:hypothetical protein
MEITAVSKWVTNPMNCMRKERTFSYKPFPKEMLHNYANILIELENQKLINKGKHVNVNEQYGHIGRGIVDKTTGKCNGFVTDIILSYKPDRERCGDCSECRHTYRGEGYSDIDWTDFIKSKIKEQENRDFFTQARRAKKLI